MKRFLTIIAILLAVLNVHAVLKEKDLGQTLQILRSELTNNYREMTERSAIDQKRGEQMRNQLMTTMKRSNQNSLMLYSQKQDYVFDLTYACHEATEQYREFQRQRVPFRLFMSRTEHEIARYDSLIISLQEMPHSVLSVQGQKDRLACLDLARKIRTALDVNRDKLADFIDIYDQTEQRLSHLNDYAQRRYNDIQTGIFRNGGDSYFSILAHFQRNWFFMTRTVEKKYRPTDNSQWDSRYIFGLLISVILYAVLASLLNFLLIRYVVPKRLRTDEFMKKRTCITMATTTVTFALILGITLATVKQNFFIMAANLLVTYAWLLGVILFSLLLRVKGDQIKSAFRIYTPLITVGFLVIAFRIILIPNELVNLLFPPILLVCALWQWNVIRRHNRNVPRSDMFYTYISLVVFVASVVCSWMGYTLLAVQVLIWWIMQLTCILTITCLSQYMKLYGLRHRFAEAPVTNTWLYDLCYQVVLPSLSVGSVMLSIWWAADVFNLSDLCWRAFKYHFIDQDNFQLSILKLTMVVCLWFLFSYLSKTLLRLLHLHFVHKDPDSAESRTVMSRNVIQIIIWGTWALLSLSVLHISVSWLLAITGGLSTGIGFASKNIIENIFYGASLMTGRIKVGDWIEVNNTMGRVTSISYTSTVVESLYGEIITFQNSQLFTNNYKNLTRNHGYVLAVVPYSVAYGSDLQQVVQLADDAVNQLKHRWMDRSKKAKSVVGELGDSGINLKMFVWADAPKKSYVISDVLNCIYNTLNQHGIEIPFPQQDVHIKQS
ncbi:MAG: mechanosensitive ion channel family protein [Prevotella sp.]|nr:mechanosensitive ion channel family protein [Prevotella sp.]